MMEYCDLIRRGVRQGYLRSRRKSSHPGLISHIIQRAVGREPLFLEDADCLYMLKVIRDIAGEYDLTVYSFCLMTNHLHLLLRQRKDNLSPAMQSLFGRCAIYFNNKYYRKGHLFCGAYRQSACYGKYYFLAASIYIHLNPVRAGLVHQAGDYRWTTWNLYCGERKVDSFVDWKCPLRLLDEDIVTAKSKYRRMMDQAQAHKADEVLEKPGTISRLSVWLRRQFPPAAAGGISRERLLENGYIDDAELNVLLDRLRSRKRLTKPTDIQARRFAIQQLPARGFSIPEIVDCLEISRPTIYNALAG
jgi:putative transposase